jgi:hypothetical protein
VTIRSRLRISNFIVVKTTTNRRIILSLDPHLLTTALAAWFEKEPGLEVVIDRSGVSIPTADPSDVVVSNRPFDSKATVLVVGQDGTSVSIHGAGHVESYRYEGLDRLAALIEARRCG